MRWIATATARAGHESGKFVFVTFHRDEGAPPFSVVSRRAGAGRPLLAIKELGDYTRALSERPAVDDPGTLEGRCGRFNFEGARERPIGGAGGAGITSFISRMELLAQSGARQPPVDLFHSGNEPTGPLPGILAEFAARSGVTPHVVVPPRVGCPASEHIGAVVPNTEQAESRSCGPTAWGHSILNGLVPRGLPADCFHQEYFEMR